MAQDVLQKMAIPTLVRHTDPRHSQSEASSLSATGLNWLSSCRHLFRDTSCRGQGLGKTVQILAHLQNLKKKGRTSLIVVSASLLGELAIGNSKVYSRSCCICTAFTDVDS
jgi:SNF2 family DNA or RNA helicase